jgi:23S rRNA (uracil1939-C5)-methyltransferase
MKEAILRESLHRAGVEWSAGVPVVPSPEIGWRARATFHVECRDGGVAVGFFQEGSHRVVDLTTPCLQVSSGMSHLILHLRERLAARRDLAPLVQRLHLAESLGGSSLVLTFEGSLGAAETHALAVLSGDSPLVTGVGAVVVGPTRDRYVSISGDPHLVHEVRDVRLRAHARSFFQANRYLVGDLVATVESLLPPGGTLIDLFGGVGLLGLAAGRTADRVVVVEQDPTSAADAAANAEAWGARVRVDACSSAEALARLRPEAGERIVVDPPRAGLEPGLIRALAERAPAVIVYVSCDPTTLARDLRRFAERGLVPDAIRALDLFPDTLHLEVVARLRTA